jgi:Protein of unknown function (DUF1579)
MRSLLSIVLALVYIPAIAQQPEEKPSQPATPPMAKPSEEQERLVKTFVGSWIVNAKIEPNEFMAGGIATGSAEFYPGPGKFYLGQQYHTTGALGDFVGNMIMWWDEKEKGFRVLWCDVLSGCALSSGLTRWQGDGLKGSQTIERMGKQWELRQSFTNIKPDAFTYEEEMGPTGGELKHVMTVQYKRRVLVPSSPRHRPLPRSH